MLLGGNHGDQGRESLGPAGAKDRIGQGSIHLADHRFWHQAPAILIPLQAGGQGCVEPPADPFHRSWQGQGLGDRQAPGPAGMGGIDDHRDAGGHGLADAVVQLGFDVAPGALNGGIAKQVTAHHIGGEYDRASELCQHRRQGGFAAGGGTDQQVAAQGGGHHCRVAGGWN